MDVAVPTPGPAQEYQLGAGDKVRVQVFGDETLSGEYQVDGRGAFTFPLVGAIAAGGLTSTQLESTLETKLKEYMRAPNVSVEILNYRPFYIVGEIRKPGSYPYVDGMTVVNAVAIAGGFHLPGPRKRIRHPAQTQWPDQCTPRNPRAAR